jgi:hypothetical protein
MRRSLRAYPAVLLVALCAVVAAPATAKPIQEIDAVVTPARAGTKSKPRAVSSKITLTTRADTAGEAEPTTTKSEVFLPSEFVLGGAVFPSCTFAQANQATPRCTSRARVGAGRAVFRSGAFSQQANVTVYNGPKGKSVLLRLDSSSGGVPIHQAIEGKLVKCGTGVACAGFGIKLVTQIPEELQQGSGLRIALTELSFTLLKRTITHKKRKVPYLGLGPCSDEELSFKAVNTYRDLSEPGVGEDTVDCSRGS